MPRLAALSPKWEKRKLRPPTKVVKHPTGTLCGPTPLVNERELVIVSESREGWLSTLLRRAGVSFTLGY